MTQATMLFFTSGASRFFFLPSSSSSMSAVRRTSLDPRRDAAPVPASSFIFFSMASTKSAAEREPVVVSRTMLPSSSDSPNATGVAP